MIYTHKEVHCETILAPDSADLFCDYSDPHLDSLWNSYAGVTCSYHDQVVTNHGSCDSDEASSTRHSIANTNHHASDAEMHHARSSRRM
jgi:hypothetical protein